ncbi:hypothetical protein [Wolbachia endosymbiont (group A) of Gastracanthus pulcherrimus]|uniref:hypothetical protein n=1 Tax=Wolbachia endosymbiont (group A) of Gastracanthus pulcherrimus TaxID=3066200 RepID=UPI003342716C
MVSFTTFSVYDYLINSLSVIISVKVWIPAPRARMTRLIVMPPHTVIPRFIRGISSANKQQDDGCRLAINV